MNADRILALKLVGDVSSINKSMKQTQGRMRSFGASVGSWTRAAGIGLAIEGVAKLGDALGDAWTGFRDGEKASAQLATTWGNLNVKGAELDQTIADIGAMALKLGTDDTEAIKAFNTALITTGGKPSQAMDRLRIAQDLVANGSAPNLQSALKLIQGAASGSARVVDKFGLKSNTAAGRVKELGRQVKGAAKNAGDADPLARSLSAIGEALETIVGAVGAPILAEFSKLMGEQIAPAVQKFADVFAENPIAAQVLTLAAAIGVLVAVSMAHPILALAAAISVLTVVGAVAVKDDWWGKFNQGMADNREAMKTGSGKVDEFGQALVHLGDLMETVVGPILRPFMGIIGATWDIAMGIINLNFDTFLRGLGTLALSIFSLVLSPFQIVWGLIKGGASLMGIDVDKSIGDLVANLGTMAGDAFVEAQKLGDNIYNGVVDGFNRLVTKVRELWNSLDFVLPPFVIPGIEKIVVPDPTGGSGFEVFGGVGPTRIWEGSGDLIPDLAKGGVIMPTPGGTLARIGEAGQAEAVIPLDRLGGMGGGATYNVIVNVAPGGDLAETGRRIVAAIRAYERGDGKVWRTS